MKFLDVLTIMLWVMYVVTVPLTILLIYGILEKGCPLSIGHKLTLCLVLISSLLITCKELVNLYKNARKEGVNDENQKRSS